MYSFSLWIDLTGRLFAESNNCNYQFVNSEVSLGFFKIGHTHFFRLFNTVDNVQFNFLPMTGFKRGPLISEATTLPTEPQPLP